MKLKKIAAIAIITILTITLTGCQDELKQQLTDCRQQNSELLAQLETQKQDVATKDEAIQNSVQLMAHTLIENDKLKAEIKKLEAQLAKQNASKKPQTPEQKTIIQKGLQELFKMQKESAEKMRLEKLKKEGQK